MSTLSSLCTGFSVILVKRGLDSTKIDSSLTPFRVLVRFLTNKSWLAGGACIILGWLFRFVSLNIADLTYVRIFLVSHLIIVVLGSSRFLKENVNKSFLSSTALILGGLVFASMSPPLTRTASGDVFLYALFFLVMIVVFLLVLSMALLARRAKNLLFALASACSFGLGATTQALFAVNVLDMSSITDFNFYISILFEPLLYVMMFFSILGFILAHFMAYKFDISLVYSISYPLSEIVVLVGSIVIFNEDVSLLTNPFRFLGIVLMLTGVTATMVTQKSRLFVSTFSFSPRGRGKAPPQRD